MDFMETIVIGLVASIIGGVTQGQGSFRLTFVAVTGVGAPRETGERGLCY